MQEKQATEAAMKTIIWESPHTKRSIINGIKKRPQSAVEYPPERLRQLSDRAWDEMRILEKLASSQVEQLRRNELDDELKKIGAVWVPSGPGLIEVPFKDDPYEHKKWSAFMGKKRLWFAAFLMRKVAAIIAGVEGLNVRADSSTREANRKLITEYGPTLLFNGRLDENQDVETYLETHNLMVSPEKVHILKKPNTNTLDQIVSLQSEEGRSFLKSLGSSTLAIVTHVPHAVRLLHLLGANNPFPPELNVVLFPIPTTPNAVQMKRDEIAGILHYTVAGNASENPYIPSNVDFSAALQ